MLCFHADAHAHGYVMAYYNKALIERGGMILDLSFIDSWDRELEEMNRGKEVIYPNSYIESLRKGWV